MLTPPDCASERAQRPASGDTCPQDALLYTTLWLMGFGHTAQVVPGDALNAFIRHHGVAGLLDSARCEHMARDCSISTLQEQRRITFQALQLGAALHRLIPGLQAHGLRPIALKGPALAVLAHGSLNARGAVDLDILLAEEDWPAAMDVLLHLGYVCAPGQRLPLNSGTHELVLQHKQWPRVELHRRLLRHQHLIPDTTGMTCEIDLQGTSITTLAPEHALAYLIAHANQHSFRRLIWLADIHALLQRPGFDMARAARQIRHTGTRAMLDTCLTLLDTLFGTVVPTELQQARRPCRASRAMVIVALQAIGESFSDDQLATRLGRRKRVMMDIALQDSPGGRLQALHNWLRPTSKDSHWVELPQVLSFLYPFIRLYRLVTRSS